MAATGVEYGSASLVTERQRMGRSHCLWAQGGGSGFGILRSIENTNNGWLQQETFMTMAQQTISATPFIGTYVGGDGSAWRSSEGTTTQGSIVQLNTDIPVGVTGSLTPPAVGDALGAIELSTSATAHNECAMEYGGLLAAKGQFGLPPGVTVTVPSFGQLPKLFWEGRFRFPQASVFSMFVGLAAPGKAGHNTVFSAADAVQKMNCIGFVVNSVAGTPFQTSNTQIQPCYGTSGGNFSVAVGSQAAGTTNTFVGNVGGIPNTADYPGTSGATAFTASNLVTSLSTDWTKIGFVFDATRGDGQNLKFFQDGVLLATVALVATGGLSGIAAANWPSNVPLNPLLYLQATGAGAAAVKLDCDWIATGQIINVE